MWYGDVDKEQTLSSKLLDKFGDIYVRHATSHSRIRYRLVLGKVGQPCMECSDQFISIAETNSGDSTSPISSDQVLQRRDQELDLALRRSPSVAPCSRNPRTSDPSAGTVVLSCLLLCTLTAFQIARRRMWVLYSQVGPMPDVAYPFITVGQSVVSTKEVSVLFLSRRVYRRFELRNWMCHIPDPRFT